MTRDELIEAMARAIYATDEYGNRDAAVVLSSAALSAIEAAGFAIVPVVASDCVGCEGKPAPENNPCAVCGRMIQAV